MFGKPIGRLLVIIAILGVAGYYLAANGLKRGLDLQGGMHLVLEVADPEGTFTPEAKADATDRALKIIRTRIDQFGVEEPIIQKSGDDRIIVELAGIRDEERAKAVIEQTAFLEFKLVEDARPVVEALPRIDRAIVSELGAEALEEAEGETAAPTQQDDVRELLFQQRDTAADTAAADTAAAEAAPDRRPLSELLASGGPNSFLVAVENVDRVNRFLALDAVQRLVPRGLELAWANEPEGQGAQLYRRLYVLSSDEFLTGEELQDATPARDPQQMNQTIVQFELSRRGGRRFETVTSQNIGRQIAIVLDEQVFSAPVVQSRIGARGQIEMGQAPLEEANDLALVLRAGALPAPLRIIEERTVGPSLGADSIAQGQLAGIVGIVLVVLIMIGYYRMAGVLAVLALAGYVLLVLGGLAAFNATLTVPGIAGLILTIGMAVDANVLIFERIREELAKGRAVRTAVDEGFSNAMSAIVDSNLTTLLTALILFQFGTGPIRGFAVTLSVGILASFFSAVYVTRTLFLLYLERRRAAAPLSI